jgi:ATP-dependent helicase/nuclease subunit B
MSKIFTVPPGRPFLDALARAILAGDLPTAGGPVPEPLALPAYTILMPTRRATRALADAFLRAAGGRALLLPRVVPISEGDDDAGLLAGLAGIGGLDAAAANIPPAIDALDRRLVLARLVLQWSAVTRRAAGDDAPVAGARTTAEAIAMATDLAALIDMAETEGADLAKLESLVPDHHSRHWQETLQFLSIVTQWWPAHLGEIGKLSPAGRRNAVLLAEARRLAAAPPSGPVIVAGVTGSIPATLKIMRAVAALPQGAIVLPSLDLHLDADGWNALLPATAQETGHPEHPQYGLARLLAKLEIKRENVQVLRGAADPAAEARAAVLSEALRPAATTDRWQTYLQRTSPEAVRTAVSGLSLIETATPAEEAEAIALILRHTLEKPGATAALVSPDRRLARRVAIRLKGWGIDIDDSAGKPFAKTPPGTFLELVVDVVRRNFEPAAVVALLGHPLARLGRTAREVRFAARALEIAALRALYLGRGPDALERALERAEADRQRRGAATRRLWPEDWERARNLVTDLRAALDPLIAAFAQTETVSLRDIAAAHAAAGERLALRPEEEEQELGGNALWQGEAGETGALLFARIADASLDVPDIAPSDYPDVFRALFGMENVRPRGPVHPRLSIWGPFESRLQQPDVVILGSLNDGIWPEAADPGPWLNRPMRRELGLPSPEEKIGYAAHDFWSLATSPRVIMTRALKVDGTPAVASRWLLRLKALLGGIDAADALTPAEPWLAWVRHRDTAPARRILPPEPRPPVGLRPRQLSVSNVETWIGNPYALYAGKVLKLERLLAIGQGPDGALRGSILHEALSRFAKRHPDRLPNDAAGELSSAIAAVLVEHAGDPKVEAFWVPRFRRFAEWFAETEPALRADTTKVLAEVDGRLLLPDTSNPFTLTARADRIDETRSGFVITDYKSGGAPERKQVVEGRAPQLPLEAAMLARGAFPGVGGTVAALRYIRASGGDPPGDVIDILAEPAEVDAVAGEALKELARLVDRYDDPETPYRATRRARFSYDYDDFAHLARIDEWSAGEGGEEA